MNPSLNEIFQSTPEKRTYSPRRSQLEIQMDILKVVHEGAYLPTQIMYRANLAWVALQDSLGTLVGNGLLERVQTRGRRSYQLTTKGINILASFNHVVETVRTPNAVARIGAV